VDKGAHLACDLWDIKEKLEPRDRELLMTPFSELEVSKVIMGTKSNLPPGPDSFTVTFFKQLWGRIKDEIMKMVHDFNNS
jgi:hypothetical protein